MKKIIILLMAVSIMLTSCGKSAGLLSSDKKADNKSPANNTSTKNQLQKIDNDNIKQSWTDDHMFAIISISIIVIAVAIGSVVWIINKNNNKLPQVGGQPQTTEQKKSLARDLRFDLNEYDYETVFLSCPDKRLKEIFEDGGYILAGKQCAFAELEKRKATPLVIPDGVECASLAQLSFFTNMFLEMLLNKVNTTVNDKKAIKFILKVRGVID